MQRPTNLIQTFRLPDKGYSPGASPLITTAIKRPVWTRDVLDMNQGSAALVSQFFLGNSRGALGKRTERPHISIRTPPSLPPTSSVCLWGARLTDLSPQQQMTFRLLYICYKSTSFQAADTLSLWVTQYSRLQMETVASFSGGVTRRLHRETIRSKIMTFFCFFWWLSLCWYCWASWNLIHHRWISLVRISSPYIHPPPPPPTPTLSHALFGAEGRPQPDFAQTVNSTRSVNS